MPEVPLLVCLHGLGLSARSYTAMTEVLGDRAEVLAIDLPGFGAAPASAGTSVEAMATYVEQLLRTHLETRPAGWGRWVLVGHSMGGKVATLVARRTLTGVSSLFGLAGVVLLAGSPPSPEPMPDEKRADLLGMADHGQLTEASASRFLDDNVGAPLPEPLAATAVTDLQRCDPEAWRAWLLHGSREDLFAAIGPLDLPALIVAGDADEALGAAAQPTINGPVYPRARFETLPGAGHLLMLERPAEVAAAILEFWSHTAGLGPRVPADTAAVIASGRVTARTRAALAARAVADDPAYLPQVLSSSQLSVLRALASRVVPLDGPAESQVDLAARVDTQLASGAGNGWRFADLPPDAEAYAAGLDALADLPSLPVDEQDALLTRAAAGDLAHWFEDCCDDLVRAWLAHPASLAEIRYDGYASGGDSQQLQGFSLLGVGEREAWEPASWT